MISLRNVERVFGKGDERTEALRGIDMDVAEGEFVSILGPSGCGKSTLLSIIGMLDAGWSGEYFFGDEAVHQIKPKKRINLNRDYMGFVFQRYHLIDDLTVFENLDVPLSYRNMKAPDRAVRVAEILDQFGLTDKAKQYPGSLSGGHQQLVGVARALVAQPKVILADEPTGNLHSAQAKEIMELFRDLNRQGTTVVQVTHSDINAAYGTRVVEMFDGELVDGGSDTGAA